MNLLFIHGRAQEGKDPILLKETWVSSFKKGLEKNDLSLPETTNIIFPYYGDLLDNLVKQAKLPISIEDALSRGDGNSTDLEFFNDYLSELADHKNITPLEIQKEFEGKAVDYGPLNWKWVHSILKALDKTNLGTLSIKKFTYDVYLYLTNATIQRRLNEFIKDSISAEPCVVVAHSLGTIVSYNVLRNNNNFSVKKFITLGSPLGVQSVRNRLDTPLSMPACVSSGWFNAYDEGDVVALQPLDKHNFDITPAIQNFGSVKNYTSNQHGIEGYLDDKTVAKEVYDALTYP